MVVTRGDLCWASLPEPVASEPGYRRPLLIVSSDAFNRSKIRTILAVVVTSNLALARAPGNVLLPRQETGLERDSVANVSQVVTADREFLTERIGRLPTSLLTQVDAGLRLVFDLS